MMVRAACKLKIYVKIFLVDLSGGEMETRTTSSGYRKGMRRKN